MLTMAIGHMVKAAVRTLDLFDRLNKMGVIDKGDKADVESAGIQALRINSSWGTRICNHACVRSTKRRH